MCYRSLVAHIAFAIIVSILIVHTGNTQTTKATYPLTQFDNSGCMAKGRVQDCPGAVMKQILADGIHAIPILISQLTETTGTKYEIADYWSGTRTGDVAYVVLTDLFTEPNSEISELPGVPDWNAVMKDCHSTAQGCWDEYLRRHGRVSVRRAWLRAWNLHKDEIFWDSKARCFRIRKK